MTQHLNKSFLLLCLLGLLPLVALAHEEVGVYFLLPHLKAVI